MKINNSTLKEQRNRLSNAFRFLKEYGISQSDISKKTDVDETTLSSLKSGKIKHISNEFLSKLHDAYGINPQYIRGNSEYILDVLGKQLTDFESFVEDWKTIDRPVDDSDNTKIEKFLHLTIDKNFYDFLIDVEKVRLVAEDGIFSSKEEIENLKEVFSAEPDLQEFVLIPRNKFVEVIQTSKNAQETFNEVINVIEYGNYLDE